MLLLGIDLGTSSIKVSVVDAAMQTCVASAQYPETEADILTPQPGWAEQSPDLWWEHTKQAILKCNASGSYDPKDIAAIGVSYQMHGLVLVDKEQKVLRNSIIWCDGRAVSIGDTAFAEIGEERCLSHLLNSPGNFTASKLAWVKEFEQEVYERIDKILLPGDFISMKFTGETTTTISALSEGIFWDFKQNGISDDVMNYFGFDHHFLPSIQTLFAPHGQLKEDVAATLSLKPGIPVTYKAGDQPNNAFSLNVLNPGEVAATAGTSGVIYGVSDSLRYDPLSRINSFAHVNHTKQAPRIGVLLCINGTGIFNRWIRNIFGAHHSYDSLNTEAAKVKAGSDGLLMLPFGNGAERMLNNKLVGAHINHVDFNLHHMGHTVRAAQEGIAFAFRYGLDIMRENGMNPSVIRAGKANMFLSSVFTESFVNATGVPVELYQTDGSIGAALGAGLGAKYYKTESEAFSSRKSLVTIEPGQGEVYNSIYATWRECLEKQLQKQEAQQSELLTV
ncbi:MAG TPA: FGGY family carbohydrate kinase [Chitinophagaceae bacterium]|jgi:xylulokinase|nr:FGGY family carbohydrate kinase [Chitinophagaceae bacterium]